jgi:hypothetical protein
MFVGQAAFASVDTGLLAMAPPESTLLVGIDVNRISSSPFGTFVLGQLQNDRDMGQFITMMGFDPRHDVQSILVAGLGRQTAGDSRYVVLARGSFDVARLGAMAQSNGSVSTQYHGTTVLVQHQGKNSTGLAFPQAGVVVFGDLATVHSVLAPDSVPVGSSMTLDPMLTEQANRVGAGNDLWFATLLSGGFIDNQISGVAPQLKGSEALQSILQSAGGVQFGDNVAVSLDLTARSPEDARSLSDLLHFAANIAQMHRSNGGDPTAAFAVAALNRMQVNANGSHVQAVVALPESQLEAAMQSHSGHHQASK